MEVAYLKEPPHRAEMEIDKRTQLDGKMDFVAIYTPTLMTCDKIDTRDHDSLGS